MDDAIQILQQTALFRELDPAALDSILRQAEPHSLSSGEPIIRENEPGDCVYVILSGAVQISKHIEAIGRQVIHGCGPGDFFGEMSVLEDKPRSAEATALEATELLSFSKEQFQAIIRQHPEVALNILRTLSRRLRETDRMLIEALEAQARKLKDENTRLYEEISSAYPTDIASRNPAMQELIGMARKAAAAAITVLLLGESGTGKEVLARCTHRWSDRKDRPFIAINCAAIPSDLLESELFGHEKGAFTGATQEKKGKFELADGGTAFLDEIGDMAEKTQAKVLRFLQEQEFEHVGGTKPIRVDVRVIAATNRDLEQEIAKGTFREDLYYRLNVVSLKLPPLREHLEDLPDLARYFLERLSREMKKPMQGIAEDVLEAFHAYPWPGNIRELGNVIERGIALCETDMLTLADIPAAISGKPSGARALQAPASLAGTSPAPTHLRTYQEAIDAARKEAILAALNATGGNQTKAARILQLERTYLSRLMKELSLR